MQKQINNSFLLSINNDFLFNKKDFILKKTYKFFNQLLLFKIQKLIITIHVPKIEKIYDYFVLQSICLVDTISGQKPKLKVLKCKYTFGSKLFSYSCKVTLRKRKILTFLSVLKYVVFSEVKRRHILINSTIDQFKNQFSFSVTNTNIFMKLDEFYFKWNYPILFTFVGFQTKAEQFKDRERENDTNININYFL
eukprot:TRINITY_DN182_c0_g1_i1.p27 TRINITY_DN182_c0_g1~~TRINITY_DN182_c0_g1_i1.p27  ORF type:complete len:194 (-),score=9.41 TRINITY_DN182_c0_g1_i1:30289-30870(-)